MLSRSFTLMIRPSMWAHKEWTQKAGKSVKADFSQTFRELRIISPLPTQVDALNRAMQDLFAGFGALADSIQLGFVNGAQTLGLCTFSCLLLAVPGFKQGFQLWVHPGKLP